MVSRLLFPFAVFLLLLSSPATAVKFKCNSTSTTCQALLGYVPTKATTYSEIKSLFQVKSIRALFGANNLLPATTTPNQSVPARSTVRVPIPCSCSRGAGVSNNRPIYTVKKGDDLDTIARSFFNGFVTFSEIADVNNITNPALILVGQKVWIPLPCNCGAVDGAAVVHYAHVVLSGSSVSEIADEFGTSPATLLRINGMDDPKSLLAGQILDVPLRSCSSSISNSSLDRSLLVPNNSYALTAGNCVLCSCSAVTWNLQCKASQGVNTSVCPAAVCSGTSGNIPLGNTTAVSSCVSTACAYAGYKNQTILTTLASESTCVVAPAAQPAPSGGHALGLVLPGFRWTKLLVLLNIVLLCSGFH